MFDPSSFLQTTVTDPFATKFEPIPPGEYIAVLEKLDTPRVTQSGQVVWDLHFSIDDADLKAAMGRDKVTCRYSVFLDTTPGGGLASGKGMNVGLGRLREAFGQNAPGAPWMPSMMQGKAAKVKIEQTPAKDKPGEVYSNVVAVSAL